MTLAFIAITFDFEINFSIPILQEISHFFSFEMISAHVVSNGHCPWLNPFLYTLFWTTVGMWNVFDNLSPSTFVLFVLAYANRARETREKPSIKYLCRQFWCGLTFWAAGGEPIFGFGEFVGKFLTQLIVVTLNLFSLCLNGISILIQQHFNLLFHRQCLAF